MLARAATNGNHAARHQLAAMTGIADPAGDWEKLASQFDLARWLSAPPSEVLSQEPLIRRFPELLPDAVCAWLIAQSRGRLTRARVYDPIIQRNSTHEMRTNTTATFGIADVGCLHFLVQARMAAGCGVALTHFEAPAVLHYDVGEQITPHFDFIDPRLPDYEQQVRVQGQRHYTFLVYLNDAYEGGENHVPGNGYPASWQHSRGSAVFKHRCARQTGPAHAPHWRAPHKRGEMDSLAVHQATPGTLIGSPVSRPGWRYCKRWTRTETPAAFFRKKAPSKPGRIVTVCRGSAANLMDSACSQIWPLLSSKAEISGPRSMTLTTVATIAAGGGGSGTPRCARSRRACRASRPTSGFAGLDTAGAAGGGAAAGAAETAGARLGVEAVG